VTAQQIEVRAPATGQLAWWRRLSPSSLLVAGITASLLWVAVAGLLRQGQLGTVLSAGRAEQDDSAGAVLLLMAGQLAEPFRTPGLTRSPRQRRDL
jgi:hypothetical protein